MPINFLVLGWVFGFFWGWKCRFYFDGREDFSEFLLIGWCPSTFRRVFPVLVFQLSKQQNRTRTNSSTVLVTPPNRTRTKKFPWKSFEAVAFLVGFSTGNPPKIGTFTAWNRTRNRTRTPPELRPILTPLRLMDCSQAPRHDGNSHSKKGH